MLDPCMGIPGVASNELWLESKVLPNHFVETAGMSRVVAEEFKTWTTDEHCAQDTTMATSWVIDVVATRRKHARLIMDTHRASILKKTSWLGLNRLKTGTRSYEAVADKHVFCMNVARHRANSWNYSAKLSKSMQDSKRHFFSAVSVDKW